MSYLDPTYIPGHVFPIQRSRNRQTLLAEQKLQQGGSWKGFVHGVKDAAEWVTKHHPIGRIYDAVEANAPAAMKTNPIFNAVKTGLKVGKDLGLGEKPRSRKRKKSTNKKRK